MYFRLPLSTSPSSRPSSAHNSSARYPLSSPPTPHATVCTQNSSATRRDSHSSDAKTARALLSRVASSPVVPQTGATSPRLPPSSPLSSEKHHHHQHHHHNHHHAQHEHEASSPTSDDRSSMVAPMERRWSDGWAGHQQREGYVSFPDFEKYFPDEEVGRQQAETYARHHAAAAAAA